MKCPHDDTTLVMSDRNGIEIDYCPQCRGVWLDRGELDKIIERAGAPTYQQGKAPAYGQQPPAPEYRESGDYQQQSYRTRKESWLSQLFD